MTTLAEYLNPSDVTSNIGTTPMPSVSTYLSEDSTSPMLRAWYSTAIDWCNAKLSERDFVDSDGVDQNPPDAVVLGVFEFVRVLRDHNARPAAGLKKTKTGAREEEYSDTGAGAMVAAGSAAWMYIEPFCSDPTLFSSGRA